MVGGPGGSGMTRVVGVPISTGTVVGEDGKVVVVVVEFNETGSLTGISIKGVSSAELD